MHLSQNFTLSELSASATASRMNIDNTPSSAHIRNLNQLCQKILQPARERLGEPIMVTSGYRCERLNREVRGVATSQHLTGEAADIVCGDNRKLWDLMTKMVISGEIIVGQLINEHSLRWIHVSLPTEKIRNQIFAI